MLGINWNRLHTLLFRGGRLAGKRRHNNPSNQEAYSPQIQGESPLISPTLGQIRCNQCGHVRKEVGISHVTCYLAYICLLVAEKLRVDFYNPVENEENE